MTRTKGNPKYTKEKNQLSIKTQINQIELDLKKGNCLTPKRKCGEAIHLKDETFDDMVKVDREIALEQEKNFF